MPAKSIKQRRAMAIAYAVKKGRLPKSKLRGTSLKLYKSMTIKQLREFATTKEKGLTLKKRRKR